MLINQETHGRILEGLSFEEIKKRVETFLKSLSRVAELVLQCVRDKKKGLKATKYGLTMFTAYVKPDFKNFVITLLIAFL